MIQFREYKNLKSEKKEAHVAGYRMVYTSLRELFPFVAHNSIVHRVLFIWHIFVFDSCQLK
jgi:hypothetical protein